MPHRPRKNPTSDLTANRPTAISLKNFLGGSANPQTIIPMTCSDPVLIAYTAIRAASGKTIWRRIGEAYPHEQGAGLTVKLDSMPLDGMVILLELDAQDDARLSREADRATGPRSPSPPSLRTSDAAASPSSSSSLQLSANDMRLAKRLLREQDQWRLTSIEIAALKAVVARFEQNAYLAEGELKTAQRLFKSLERRLS